MVGETISHYRILEELGGGAMGVVYKALDIRLKRQVALKFLPPGLTRDAEARQRFIHEAEAASALDDPHVCTIYDIDQTEDGRVFIAMALYEGGTLKKHIQRGPMPLEDVIAFSEQIARGLATAHEAGIVHRDIKPANVMITTRKEVKIVDFGIAKLSTQADLTGTGLSLGTVQYMAPEQFQGQVDARADLWALGVTMFEMLTGRRPFEGATSMEVMNAVLHSPTPALRKSRSDVPEDLAAIVDRALQKNPAQRIGSAAEMAAALNALHAQPTVTMAVRDDTSALLRAVRRPIVAVPAVLVIALLGYASVTTLTTMSRARWAREEAIPEINRLLQADEYDKAYSLALEADRYIPNDPVLGGLMPQITARPMFSLSGGSNVRVSARRYDSKDEWRLLDGPFEDVRLPRGTYRWRVEADGINPIEFARNVGEPIGQTAVETITLATGADRPPDMVEVGPSRAPIDITGFATEDPIVLDRFAIDRHEVTNRQFKEFVAAGGYTRQEYWKHTIVQDGRALPFEQAISLFHDTTGKPGPASWELGDFPAGQADFPVSGVSWYEAAAYAEFRGASLPTIYHWARAALAFTRPTPIRGLIVNASNFNGKSTVAVESSGALGPFGTFDMAGNVREWCVNAAGDNRWILGGAWNDHAYMYIVPYSLPPLDRSAVNGFRLVRYSAKERVAELSTPIQVFRRDFRTAKPVSDEIFDVFKRQFTYTAAPVAAKVEMTDASANDWVRERVSIDTGNGERMPVDLLIPKGAKPPYQAVVYYPGLTGFVTRISSQGGPPGAPPSWFALYASAFDFVVKSGRILVFPILKGSFERYDGFVSLTGDRYQQTFRQRMHEWRQETGQLLDYLATRNDVQADRIAWGGVSFGSSTMLPVLAMEPRFKAAVLQLAGLPYRDLLPEVDPVNFVSRIKIPVLMLEGRYDHLFPPEESQQPLLLLLGSPADQKRSVLFDAGHGPLPRGQVIHEVLSWLDKYLGPTGPPN